MTSKDVGGAAPGDVANASTVRVAVVCHGWTGHRLHYLACLVDFAASMPESLQVIPVVDAHVSDTGEWAETLAPRNVSAYTWQGLAGASQIERVQALRQLASEFDRVVVLDAETWLLPAVIARLTRAKPNLGLQLTREPLLPRPTSLKAMRTMCAGVAKAALVVAASGRDTDVYVLESPLFGLAGLASWMQQTGRCIGLVDPVLASASPRSEPNSDSADRPRVSIVGSLDDPRKAVPDVLRAFSGSAELSASYELVLAGRASTKVTDAVDGARRTGCPIDLRPHHLSERELLSVIDSSIALLCLSPEDMPSGLATIATQRGCPVIAMRSTRLGVAVDYHGLGASIADIDPSSLTEAIGVCLQRDRDRVRTTSHALMADATPQRFATTLLRSAPACEPGIDRVAV